MHSYDNDSHLQLLYLYAICPCCPSIDVCLDRLFSGASKLFLTLPSHKIKSQERMLTTATRHRKSLATERVRIQKMLSCEAVTADGEFSTSLTLT